MALVVLLYLIIFGAAACLTFAAFGDLGRAAPSDAGSRHFFRAPATAPLPARRKIFEAGNALVRRAGLPADQLRMLSFLEDHCTAVPVRSATATALTHPSQFYEALKRKIVEAQESIFFSALYIGDGPLSKSFVGCLEEKVDSVVAAHEARLAESGAAGAAVVPFEICILLDYNRMQDRRNLVTVQRLLTTGHAVEQRFNSCGGGDPAVNLSPVKVRLYLYQGPCRWNGLFAPFSRAKEVLGVQHTKLFVFDRVHAILTGANLSDDYFASRMDRYMVYERNEHLAFFYLEMLKVLFALSHPVVSLAEYCGPLGGSTSDLHRIEPQSPLRRIKKLLKERKAAAATTGGEGAASPVIAKSIEENIVFPFGMSSSSGSGGFDHSHGSPTLHKASALVILPNALGFDPSTETAAYQSRAYALCTDFAQRMAIHFHNKAHDLLLEDSNNSGSGDVYDGVIFPTFQFGRVGVHHDAFIVKSLLLLASSRDHVFLTSPYLNVYADFLDVLIGKAKSEEAAIKAQYPLVAVEGGNSNNSSSKTTTTTGKGKPAGADDDDGDFLFDCVTASVKTNGWNGQRGFAGYIPLFYLQLERVFYFLVKAYGCVGRVRIHEFTKEGLTFHAKGIYFTPTAGEEEKKEEGGSAPGEPPAPYLVAYGSTNYGYRSVHKDVEAEAFFFSFNAAVRAQMRLELHCLLQQSTTVEEGQFLGSEMGRFQPVVSLVAQMGQDFL